MAAPQDLINRFVQAGLLDPSKLNQDDQKVIEQLTEAEVDVLINIATRLYPDARGMVKLGDLTQGNIRIFVPL